MPGPYTLITVQGFLSWPPANYDDPVERPWLAPYAISLLGLSTICVAGRVYLRSRRGRLPWDDYLLIIAWVRTNLYCPHSAGISAGRGACFLVAE